MSHVLPCRVSGVGCRVSGVECRVCTFFDNKEDLCAEVMAKIAEDFLADFRQQVKGFASPLDAIFTLVEVRLRHVQDHGGFIRLFMESKPGSRVTPDSAIPRHCRGLYDTYVSEVTVLFEDAIARRLVRKMEPLYAALLLEGAINAFSAYWGRKEMMLPLAECVETVRRNCLEMIKKQGGERFMWTKERGQAVQGLAAVAVIGLFLAGCGPRGPQGRQQMGPAEVSVLTVKTEQLVLTTELPGRTAPYRMALICRAGRRSGAGRHRRQRREPDSRGRAGGVA